MRGGESMNEAATIAVDSAISQFISEQKITREKMAKLLGISANTLRWKREGRYDWSWSEILRLCDLLDKSPNELAGIKS